MGSTRTNIIRLLLLALLVTGYAWVVAQEPDMENQEATQTVAVAKANEAPEPIMSPAGDESGTLAVSSELVMQSANTVMTSGTCSVIDDFLRQYCTTNPGDISCQFQ